LTKEEAYIQKLDGSTGASLKLTVLNAEGRIWTMVAGGGASVVYSDAIAAHGFAHELANYGEYSGAPTEGQTYEYAKTISKLLCLYLSGCQALIICAFSSRPDHPWHT
jgi:ATP citrate (pro-S)-lyase